MIWLYTPVFDGLGNLVRPEGVPENEKEINPEIPRTFVQLHDPEYLTGIAKPTKITLKRSMNDTVRTYVVYDRSGTTHHDVVLRFDHLTTNRMKALEQFLLNTEGKNIGYKSPRDQFCGCVLLNSDALITVDHPGVTWDDTGKEVISEWGNVELHLRIIKGSVL